MAIGLPPVDVYLSSTFVGYTLPAASTEMSLPLGNTVLRVRGVRLLSTAAVGRALAGRLSLAAAADALADAYEGAGWRNVLVVVVDRPGEQIGEQMLVVHETGLSAVLGVDPLTVYFRPFIGPAPIRRSAFAIAARMAELHAGRTGADATALYQRSLEVPEKLTLRVGDDAPASRPPRPPHLRPASASATTACCPSWAMPAASLATTAIRCSRIASPGTG